MRTTRLWALLTAVAVVVAACGGGESGGAPVEALTEVTVVGERISFDVTEVRVKAGEEITITFENRDTGIPHNLRIEGPEGPIKTEIANGPVTQTLTLTIDRPGVYRFLCEVHPSSMVGQLIVEG
jgi:plastocyanin